MALTVLKVKNAKPGRHVDGRGLCLVVKPSGARTWVLRMQLQGHRRDYGLGSAHDVSLTDARTAAAELRRRVRDGFDPVAERRKAIEGNATLPEDVRKKALALLDAAAEAVKAEAEARAAQRQSDDRIEQGPAENVALKAKLDQARAEKPATVVPVTEATTSEQLAGRLAQLKSALQGRQAQATQAQEALDARVELAKRYGEEIARAKRLLEEADKKLDRLLRVHPQSGTLLVPLRKAIHLSPGAAREAHVVALHGDFHLRQWLRRGEDLTLMDGATALNARMAYNKAYTATKWQMDTRVLKTRLFDMSLGDERREITWFCDPLYTPVWGGIVLRAPDGTMLGALGESGGTYQQDEEIGQIAAARFNAYLASLLADFRRVLL